MGGWWKGRVWKASSWQLVYIIWGMLLLPFTASYRQKSSSDCKHEHTADHRVHAGGQCPKLNFWTLEQKMLLHCWHSLVVHFGKSRTTTEVAHPESSKDRTKCDKMLLKVSGWSFTVSGSSYWILAKSKFLMLEELTLLLGTCRFIPGIQCLPPDQGSFTQLKHAFPKAWGFWNDCLAFLQTWHLWVNTATRALHTAHEHPVASTELWKQTSHISLEVVFEHVYLQLTVNGSAFMSRIVCC